MAKYYRKRSINIVALVPKDVPDDAIAGYIMDAVERMGTHLPPDHALYCGLAAEYVGIGKTKYGNPKPKDFNAAKGLV